jgi:hypothetical protein
MVLFIFLSFLFDILIFLYYDKKKQTHDVNILISHGQCPTRVGSQKLTHVGHDHKCQDNFLTRQSLIFSIDYDLFFTIIIDR